MIQEAFGRLKGIANQTPVMTSRTLNRLTGQQVFLKCENFQRGGSFKFRGAYNTISQLTPEQKQKGIVAFSSGNHAQGVALAANILGIQAMNCMPQDAPSIKVQATKGYGVEVVFYDRQRENREEIAEKWSEEKGMTIIPPFDDPRIISGAGTAALELLKEVGELDAIIAPIGGGGLISGTALAAHGINPSIRIFGVEPEGAEDTLLSLQAGKRITIDPPHTIADGLRVTTPGHITFPIIQQHIEQVITVTDHEIMEALRFALTRLKIVIEPSSAVALAAVLTGRLPLKENKRIGVIISGGNVDPSLLAKLF
jgi:threonine dehydratase